MPRDLGKMLHEPSSNEAYIFGMVHFTFKLYSDTIIFLFTQVSHTINQVNR